MFLRQTKEKFGLDYKMKIFLDDVRDPPDNTWTVVRSYDAFTDLLNNTLHIITEISFDHDLGADEQGNVLETGMDAAKFFIEKAMDEPIIGLALEKVIVHSSNPAGRSNIGGYFESARDQGILNPNILITY